jgi:hypothetical protein
MSRRVEEGGVNAVWDDLHRRVGQARNLAEHGFVEHNNTTRTPQRKPANRCESGTLHGIQNRARVRHVPDVLTHDEWSSGATCDGGGCNGRQVQRTMRVHNVVVSDLTANGSP